MSCQWQPWARLLQEEVCECDDRQAQLWNVWQKVQVCRDLLQREVREPEVRQEKLRGLQQQVQERECRSVWDVQLCIEIDLFIISICKRGCNS